VPIYGQGIDPNVINNWTVQNGSSDETLGAFYPRRGVLANNNTNAGSLHPGGCQIVMGDGAVRFLSEQTASSILVQLKRMRDGHAPQDW
jgi:prepilin-type processing-associated H-X9-DG protein